MNDGALAAHQSSASFLLPTATNQTAYFLTGGLAGLSILPIEYILQRTTTSTQPSNVAFLRSHLPGGLYRPAIRFWAFDLARSSLNHLLPPPSRASPAVSQASTNLHIAAIGGASGAVGGSSEILVQSLFLRRVPSLSALVSQSSKLFLCFGSYTYLSNAYSDTRPPRPFWKCWSMGAAAGAFGSAVMAAVEGVRGRALLIQAGKGAAVIGTVISVQVTSCKDLLDWVEET